MNNEAFCELRLYQVEPGRMDDMVERLRGPLATLFERHGIHPLQAWRTSSGPQSPLFVYLMRWPSWQAREAAWAGFYSDPEWARAREATNRGSELVQRYELHLLREVTPFCAPQAGDFARQELYLPEIGIGRSVAARHLMAQQAPEAIAAHGAQVLGAYEFITGNDLPRACMVLGWRDAAVADDAIASLELPPLGRAQRYQLHPLVSV